MNITIIVFSPSGNTNMVGHSIKEKLELKGHNIQYVNLEKNSLYLNAKNKKSFLLELIKPHDILLIGGPVYAHHLQYNVKDLISYLPNPENGWSNLVIPFVTYGNIDSGIALEESGKLLKKRNRKTVLGAKFSTSHKISRAFLYNEYNENYDKELINVTRMN